MRGSWFRGAAVAVTSVALVVGPGAVVLADHGGVVRDDAPPTTARAGQEPARVRAAAPTGLPWLAGSMARSLRRTEVPGERYTALAADLVTERRADAVALAGAALAAARAAGEVGDVVEPAVVQRLTDGVVRLSALLDRADFAGVTVRAAADAMRLPDAAVAPAPLRPSRDLALAASIDDAAAEVFRLSVDVEVAAREAELADPIGGPGDLRAPAGLTPVQDADEATPTAEGADGEAGTAEDETSGAPGAPGSGTGDATRGEPAHGGPGARSADPAPGSATTPAGPAGPADPAVPAGRGGGASPGADARAEASDGGRPDGTAERDDAAQDDAAQGGAAQGGAAQGGTEPGDSEPGDTGDAAADDAAADPASLDALPPELVEGLTALEDAVAAASALLEGGILDDVAFLTPERARELAAAQGLGAADVAAWAMWRNGRVPVDELCAVEFAPGALLRCDAAYALELLNVEYRAEFGEDIGVVSSYRTYDEQVRLKAQKGWLAATPGRSNHGWGVAVDLAGMGALGDFSSPRHRWMVEHGPAYGWHHPRGMRPGGSGPPEPWHFEFGAGPGGDAPRGGLPAAS